MPWALPHEPDRHQRQASAALINATGTASPHARGDKESSCGCAGCYTAHAALELYAEVFEEENALDQLEAFASFNGPDFYRLPRNSDSITLTKETQSIPEAFRLGDSEVVPIRAGDSVGWTVSR